MTQALWIANVVVAILVVADMLYGRHMAKKMMGTGNCCSIEAEETIDMDYCELEMRDEEIEKRVCSLEEAVKKLNTKRTSKKTSTKKKK